MKKNRTKKATNSVYEIIAAYRQATLHILTVREHISQRQMYNTHWIPIVLLFVVPATSQNVEFTFENSEWRVWTCCNPIHTRSYYFDGDTIQDNLNYKKAYLSYDTIIGNSDDSYYGAVREEDNQIFWKFSGSEHSLYDLNLSIGDTVELHPDATDIPFTIVAAVYDSIILEVSRRIIRFEKPEWGWVSELWIAGIGSTYGLFEAGDHPGFDFESQLLCVSADDSLIFFNENIGSCFESTVSISPVENNPTVRLFPNPASSELNVATSQDLISQSYWIYNLEGVTVLSGIFKDNKISIQQLPNGVFYLSIGQRSKIIGKFVKHVL